MLKSKTTYRSLASVTRQSGNSARRRTRFWAVQYKLLCKPTRLKYNSLEQVVETTNSNRSVTKYEFDSVQTMTDNSGVTTHSYNDRDELASVSRDGQTIRYQHDLVGRVTGVNYPNGVNCRHQFSERNQLLKREYLNGSNPLLTLKYSFNQVGQRILDERISPQGTIQRNFGYDSQRHLTNSRRTQGRNVSYHNYCFDDNDNITQKDGVNFTVNSDDQLKRAGTIQLGYNAAGQAVTVNPKNIRYSYNDQIKSVTSPGTSVTMLYDGAGQRVAKTVNGQTARYLWNGGEILKEYAPDGTTKAEYLLGMGREAIKVGGAWKFYLKDIQGSTLGLVDAQGHVTDSYEYSDYGDTISRTGNSYNPFLYTGQDLDAELGMYHLRARHYSPTLSRFIARDPIGHAGGSNLYAYCSGDPVNASDPSGLCPRSQLKIKGSASEQSLLNKLLDKLMETKMGRSILARVPAGTVLDIGQVDGSRVVTSNSFVEPFQVRLASTQTMSEYFWIGGKSVLTPTVFDTGAGFLNLVATLGHELGHVVGFDDNTVNSPYWVGNQLLNLQAMANVMATENHIRAELGLPIRLTNGFGAAGNRTAPSPEEVRFILSGANR